MGYRLFELVFDCADPQALARFYAGLLGGRMRHDGPEWSSIHADPVILGFQRVPEGKAVKNRCHPDFVADDLEAATAHAESLGATRLGAVIDEAPGRFQVMADPEGNEFCFVSGYTEELT